MRLTCPNCGAEYDVSDGMVPAAGRHVQCSDCHTRWFVRGARRPAPSEDQILTRLEARAPRPRPVLVAENPTAEVAAVPAAAVRAAEPVSVAAAAPVADAAPEPEAEPEHFDWTAVPEPARAAPSREPLAKPGDRPTVTRPGTVDDLAPPRPRLDLADTVRAAPEPAAPARSRFLRGLLLVLIPALIAFGAYRYGDQLAARVPATAPALDSYAEMIDGLRSDLERRLDEYRGGSGG